MCSENPSEWRFTWEAQSHSPTLKLFLFDSHTKPSIQCHGLQIRLNISQSHLLASWNEVEEPQQTGNTCSIKVPIPRVLVDPDSPVSFRALDDHIEAKLVILLPVDHPIVSQFDSALDLDVDGDCGEIFDAMKPLSMDSGVKSLSSSQGVHFYCRNCSNRLTRSLLKQFEEMPSVNWRELADNWFGNCCCSFGGVSEKLVNNYAHTYACTAGVCLLDSTAVTLCKDDLVGCRFSDGNGVQMFEHEQEFTDSDDSCEAATASIGISALRASIIDAENERTLGASQKDTPAHLNSKNLAEKKIIEEEAFSEAVTSRPLCCDSTCHSEANPHDVAEPLVEDQKATRSLKLMSNQRSFLDGFLGNCFMARSYNLSKDIEWKQFVCSQCSCLLGNYPCANGDLPVDDGIRLFKCNISTSLRVGGSDDYFRNYTLEKMFTSQLVESAKDELSYRTVVRDLKLRLPMLQVVLLNPNSWCCSGNCLDAESNMEFVSKLDLRPVIKVLFSDCSSGVESKSSLLEDWMTKNLADEVFMSTLLIVKLIETMESAKHKLPPSSRFVHGLSLTSLLR